MLAGLPLTECGGAGPVLPGLVAGLSGPPGIILASTNPCFAPSSASPAPMMATGAAGSAGASTSAALSIPFLVSPAATSANGALPLAVTGSGGFPPVLYDASQTGGTAAVIQPLRLTESPLALANGVPEAQLTPLVLHPGSDAEPQIVLAVWNGDDPSPRIIPVANRLDAVAAAADKLIGEVAEEVTKGMKHFRTDNRNGENLGGTYDAADAGAFGKEFERRVHARLQELAASGNKTAGQFLEGIYVDGKGLVTPGGGPGTTQVDALFVRKGYRPEVGKPLDPSQVIAYEIKTSKSGRVERDQLERLLSLSDLEVRAVHSRLRYAQDARGLFGVVENPRFTAFVRVLQALGDKLPAIITGGTVVIRALSAEAQEREDMLEDELGAILRNLNSTTDPNERQGLELDAWNRIREILKNRGIDLDPAVEASVIRQIMLSQ